MKPLKLAAVAVTAGVAITGCSSDIVVKTDLDEKWVVKDSTVTSVPFGTEELISSINEHEYQTLESFRKCVSIYGNKKDYVLNSKIEDLSECERKHYVRDGKSWLPYATDIMAAKKEAEEIHYFGIRFRPFFVDLNRKKNAMGYQDVACINPKLKERTLAIWDWYEGIKKIQPIEMPPTVYGSIRQKLCKKYAKF